MKLLCTTVFTLAITTASFADTTYVPVGDDLQAAINSASEGDVLVLEAGTYYCSAPGFGTDGTSITIQGQIDKITGLPTSILSASGDPYPHRAWYSSVTLLPDFVLENLVFANGRSNDTAGMFIVGSPTLNNCTFRDNIGNPGSYGGGAMRSHNGSPVLTDCRFENNQHGSDAPWITYGGVLTITRSGSGQGLPPVQVIRPIACNNAYPYFITNSDSLIVEDGCFEDSCGEQDEESYSRCLFGSECIIGHGLTYESCTAAGGTWFGESGSCIDCEPPVLTGACCVSSGCDSLTEVSCVNMGGTWISIKGGTCDDCVAPPETCDADLDGDGEVKVADLLLLIGAWGVCP